jgi:hypothetical protein
MDVCVLRAHHPTSYAYTALATARDLAGCVAPIPKRPHLHRSDVCTTSRAHHLLKLSLPWRHNLVAPCLRLRPGPFSAPAPLHAAAAVFEEIADAGEVSSCVRGAVGGGGKRRNESVCTNQTARARGRRMEESEEKEGLGAEREGDYDCVKLTCSERCPLRIRAWGHDPEPPARHVSVTRRGIQVKHHGRSTAHLHFTARRRSGVKIHWRNTPVTCGV